MQSTLVIACVAVVASAIDTEAKTKTAAEWSVDFGAIQKAITC